MSRVYHRFCNIGIGALSAVYYHLYNKECSIAYSENVENSYIKQNCNNKPHPVHNKEGNSDGPIYDIAVIGGGIVGLAVAQACSSKLNKSIVIIEKEDVVAAG